MKDQFCAIYHRYGIQEKEHFDTKEKAIRFLELGYKNDQCYPDMVIDLSTHQIVWRFDIIEFKLIK